MNISHQLDSNDYFSLKVNRMRLKDAKKSADAGTKQKKMFDQCGNVTFSKENVE